MIPITSEVALDDSEVELTAIRAQGAGGQNVNKVASAIHLRFDISGSSLPEHWKQRLRGLGDNRVTQDGQIVIKAQQFRTQEKNRVDAIERLQQMIRAVTRTPKTRKPTRPSLSAKARRTDKKKKRGNLKRLRGKVSGDQ